MPHSPSNTRSLCMNFLIDGASNMLKLSQKIRRGKYDKVSPSPSILSDQTILSIRKSLLKLLDDFEQCCTIQNTDVILPQSSWKSLESLPNVLCIEILSFLSTSDKAVCVLSPSPINRRWYQLSHANKMWAHLNLNELTRSDCFALLQRGVFFHVQHLTGMPDHRFIHSFLCPQKLISLGVIQSGSLADDFLIECKTTLQQLQTFNPDPEMIDHIFQLSNLQVLKVTSDNDPTLLFQKSYPSTLTQFSLYVPYDDIPEVKVLKASFQNCFTQLTTLIFRTQRGACIKRMMELLPEFWNLKHLELGILENHFSSENILSFQSLKHLQLEYLYLNFYFPAETPNQTVDFMDLNVEALYYLQIQKTGALFLIYPQVAIQTMIQLISRGAYIDCIPRGSSLRIHNEETLKFCTRFPDIEYSFSVKDDLTLCSRLVQEWSSIDMNKINLGCHDYWQIGKELPCLFIALHSAGSGSLQLDYNALETFSRLSQIWSILIAPFSHCCNNICISIDMAELNLKILKSIFQNETGDNPKKRKRAGLLQQTTSSFDISTYFQVFKKLKNMVRGILLVFKLPKGCEKIGKIVTGRWTQVFRDMETNLFFRVDFV